MIRALLIFLLVAISGEVAAGPLVKYPYEKMKVPKKTMLCRTPDLVNLEAQAILGDPEEGFEVTHCITAGDHTIVRVYFERTGSTSKYIYDVLQLKVWREWPNSPRIYRGTFYSVGFYDVKRRDEHVGELNAPPTN